MKKIKTKFDEKLDEVRPIYNKLRACAKGTMFLDLNSDDINSARISFFPEGDGVESATRAMLELCRKFTKGNDRTITGHCGNITICIFNALNCRIVGTKKVARPIMKQVGMEEVDEPIYECVSSLIESNG